ncbi:acyltransferase [soil metagenome]
MVQPDDAPFVLGFRPSLEGLRGVAIILVIVFHTTVFLMPSDATGPLPGGFVGVDVFFVLSGFLITALVLQELRDSGDVSLRRFYQRRLQRVLPALAMLLGVATLYVWATGLDLRAHLTVIGYVLSGSANWFRRDGAELTLGLSHLWSLAIEIQFYVVWPMLLVALYRRARPLVIAGVVLVTVLAAASLRGLLFASQHDWSSVYFRTDARLDQLLTGALLACALTWGWLRPLASGLVTMVGLAVVLAVSAVASTDSSWYYLGGATAVALATAAVLASTLEGTDLLSRWLSWPPLRWVGRLSYSLFLWHVPMYFVVARHLGSQPTAVRVTIGQAASLLVAWISFRFVEAPLLGLRHSARAPAPAAVSTTPRSALEPR